jgi:hypothetical protein
MFHAHQTEFTEKGWMGFFDVTTDGKPSTIMNTATHSAGTMPAMNNTTSHTNQKNS